jgi:dihydroflavonol-4-reductase
MSAVLVTGGTGFLGLHLVHHLLDAGDTVRVLAREPSRSLERLEVECIQGSILDREIVHKAMTGCDRVYHAAGLVSRDPEHARQMYQVHVDGTRVLCEVACEVGVDRVVVASSSGTIGVSENAEPIPDENAPYPVEQVGRWPYYLSKIYQEQVALSFHREKSLPLVIVNPSLLLGPGDDRLSSTSDVLKFLRRQIPSVPSGGINFVDVRDAAIAMRTAMEKGHLGERYLLGGPNWTMAEFFKRLERCSKVEAPLFKLPRSASIFGARILEQLYALRDAEPPVDTVSVDMAQHYWYVDSSKAKRELGFQPREPGETLADTVRYLREHFIKGRPSSASLRA